MFPARCEAFGPANRRVPSNAWLPWARAIREVLPVQADANRHNSHRSAPAVPCAENPRFPNCVATSAALLLSAYTLECRIASGRIMFLLDDRTRRAVLT